MGRASCARVFPGAIFQKENIASPLFGPSLWQARLQGYSRFAGACRVRIGVADQVNGGRAATRGSLCFQASFCSH
jgi:hypothetical protein